jgi:hypothetical protein
VLSEVLTEFLNIIPTSFYHSNVTRRNGAGGVVGTF